MCGNTFYGAAAANAALRGILRDVGCVAASCHFAGVGLREGGVYPKCDYSVLNSQRERGATERPVSAL